VARYNQKETRIPTSSGDIFHQILPKQKNGELCMAHNHPFLYTILHLNWCRWLDLNPTTPLQLQYVTPIVGKKPEKTDTLKEQA
jgi:hypothetical protein